MFRTLKAKYPGVCKRCHASIYVGDTIRYGGPGRVYHLASECAKGAGYTDDPPYAHLGNYTDPDLTEDTAEPSSGIAPSAYRARYTRFSSGAEVFTNARGRCEDAPCCGCCS